MQPMRSRICSVTNWISQNQGETLQMESTVDHLLRASTAVEAVSPFCAQ